MQVNSHNLYRLGVTLTEAFDPCKNIALGSRVYLEGVNHINSLENAFPSSFAHMQGALSLYNTGNPWKGFANGYVGRVMNYIAYGIDLAASAMEVEFTQAHETVRQDDMVVDFK